MDLGLVPDRRCAVTRAITTPLIAVAVPHSNDPVVLEHRTLVYECPDPDGCAAMHVRPSQWHAGA